MSPPQRNLPDHPAKFVPTPLTSYYHISPSVSRKPFAQSDAFLFCFITRPLAIVCAVHWNVQLREAGTSDLPLLMTVSPANDPSQGSTNIFEWAREWRLAPGNSGRLCFSLPALVQPPLALITGKCVSTGSRVSSRRHGTVPVAHATQPRGATGRAAVSARSELAAPGSLARPRRPGESESEGGSAWLCPPMSQHTPHASWF